MLAHVLTGELVLRNAVHRGGDVGDLVSEAAVGRVELHLRARPPHVYVERFLGERAGERSAQRGRDPPVEVDGFLVPEDLAVGQEQEQVLRTVLLPPLGDLPAAPHRLGRIGGGEEQEVPRVVDCLGDRGPQTGVGGERCLVPEDLERAPPVPRLRELAQGVLDPLRQQVVAAVAVRDEHVVAHDPILRRTRLPEPKVATVCPTRHGWLPPHARGRAPHQCREPQCRASPRARCRDPFADDAIGQRRPTTGPLGPFGARLRTVRRLTGRGGAATSAEREEVDQGAASSSGHASADASLDRHAQSLLVVPPGRAARLAPEAARHRHPADRADAAPARRGMT